ncbi:hypothetical protein PSHT_11181 [Puccinia striiformis]|uniref:Uncharacterized protein n=1 Tax=Puccinia striiformis TaxID=27350 RepID=A0A2S4V510_9BASI|nr:hypothetical protein PSHT_11181 [Puccinia striiformis]
MTISFEAPSHIPQDCGHEEAFRDSDTTHRVASLALDAGPGPSRSDPNDVKPLQYDSGTSQVWHSLLIHPKDLWTSSASLDNKYACTWNDVHQPEFPEPNNARRPDKGIQTNHQPVPMIHGEQTSPWQADLHIHHQSKLPQSTDKPTQFQTDETLKDREKLDVGKTPVIQLENTLQILDDVPEKQSSKSECDLIKPTAEQHSVTGTKESQMDILSNEKNSHKGKQGDPSIVRRGENEQQLAWKAKKKWDVQDISQDRKNANPYIGETSHRVDSSKPIPVDTNHEELSWVAQKEPLPNPRIESKLEGKATGEVSQAPLENTDQEETSSSLREPLAQHSNTEEKVKLNNSKHIGLQDKQPKLLAINFSNPGWDSPDMIPSSEEKHILDLIKNRQITENLKLITKAEIRSDVNYDAQAEILNSEFQKLKTSQRLDNISKSPVSMMSSLDIEPQFTKKIQQVYEDMMFTPEKQGFKTTRLCDYSKSTVEKFYEIWGWEAVISWEKNRLDIGLMTQLALLLNLDHETSHFGISPCTTKGQIYMKDF